ncbi:MAG: peptidyl-prolyl cis-trans isomerase [Alphaproteobacteria bacterium]|nr:peptidyl-prolyl cis-trans isomerase [Alphaproteobacteria bacterium]
MQKKYIFATSAALVVLIAGAFTYKVYAERNNGVAAIVNGEQITMAEIKEAYEQNPQISSSVKFEDFYSRALDVMVNSKLALQAATKANIQATPEYQKQLANLQDEVARQVYLDQLVSSKVTEENIKKVYDEYVANFKSAKEVKAKHILVDSEELAKEIIAKLDNKEASFDDLAKKNSKDQPELGYFTEEMMVPEFSKAAFAMEKNTYSKEPVKTEFGYHVIFVEDIRDSEPLPFEAVEEQIKANLAQQAVAEVVEDLNKNATIEKFDINGKKIENKAAK